LEKQLTGGKEKTYFHTWQISSRADEEGLRETREKESFQGFNQNREGMANLKEGQESDVNKRERKHHFKVAAVERKVTRRGRTETKRIAQGGTPGHVCSCENKENARESEKELERISFTQTLSDRGC